ncbi:hypothetical protein [Methylobacterium sp. A54F]
MPIFQIRVCATGEVLWRGPARDELSALDAMAREAGYYGHPDLPARLWPSGVIVERLNN